jgi:hypothetical protein
MFSEILSMASELSALHFSKAITSLNAELGAGPKLFNLKQHLEKLNLPANYVTILIKMGIVTFKRKSYHGSEYELTELGFRLNNVKFLDFPGTTFLTKEYLLQMAAEQETHAVEVRSTVQKSTPRAIPSASVLEMLLQLARSGVHVTPDQLEEYHVFHKKLAALGISMESLPLLADFMRCNQTSST